MALVGSGAYLDNPWMMLSAFIMVCGFRIYEGFWQAKWKPVGRSIILKYEEALSGMPESQELD